MTPAQPADLTPAAQDYLKVIWSAREWSSSAVTTKLLAERLGVGAPTVSDMVRRLSARGLVEHAPYGAIALTEVGSAYAVAMVRRHRIIETLLVRELGYGWDEVHAEAEVLEHAVSDLLIERIDIRLGRPARDPHGDPIPTPDGRVPIPAARPLWGLEPGDWVVARVSDADPDLLRYCASVGLGLDARLTVLERDDRAGEIALRVDGRTIELPKPAASALWAVPA